MNILITGGAGFIGTNLTERLLHDRHQVVCIDNFTLGSRKNIAPFLGHPGYSFYERDMSTVQNILDCTAGHAIDYIFHLAANSDIQLSGQGPAMDYKNTFQTTCAVLEYMRTKNVRRLFFSSSGAVYGEKPGVVLTESAPLAPVSYYGGAKMASEALIAAYAAMNDWDVILFRFPNVIGPHLTHGVIFDFLKKLQAHPDRLEILGDGTQRKSYLYVHDLIDAMLHIGLSDDKGVNIYNVGGEGATTVTEIADMVCARLNLKEVAYSYTGGDRGWKGDIPTFQFDMSKIHQRGWQAQHRSTQAVQATLDAIFSSNV